MFQLLLRKLSFAHICEFLLFLEKLTLKKAMCYNLKRAIWQI